jgi:threonine-phosphate decarboxylase
LRLRKELMDAAACAHGGKSREIAGRMGIDEKTLIDFSVNLNPYFPLDARETIQWAYDTIFSYPDDRYDDFRRSAARFAGVGPDNIIPGNGSMEIIRLIAEAAIEKGDIVAIPVPTFGEYERQCRLFSAVIRPVSLSDITNKEYSKLKGCRMAFFCNPNNPDGRLRTAEQMEEIIKYCDDNDMIAVVDEAFIDLSDPGQSVAGLVEKYDNLLVMRSLTKCFAIPGMRLGFGISSKTTADALNKARLTWNMDSLAVEAGIFYMDNADGHLEASRAYIKKEREWLADEIKLIRGIKPLPASANYFLADVSGAGMSPTVFADKMLEERIIVRDCGSFQMRDCIRLAVRSHEDNVRLVDALRKVAGAEN